MKSYSNFVKYAIFAFALVLFASCGGNEDKDKTSVKKSAPNDNSSLSIRYIDRDSLLKNYNLAKDLNEAMLRNSNRLEAVHQQKAVEIQKFASQVQNKYQSNGYLSEASFNADQQKLQKMQADAENYMNALQRNIQNETQQGMIQLQDSISNFINQYNKQKGYDMILDKNATFYIDEKFDITQEVIKGLNARYNKVETKK